MNCFDCPKTVVLQTIVSDGMLTVLQQRPDVSPIFAMSAYVPNFTRQLSQFASEPSNFGIPMVFLVSRMPPASADMTQGLAARFAPTNGSRIPALSLEQQRRTSQAAFSATLQPTQISTQHCRGSATMIESALRRGRNGMCVLARLWLDEMSV